MFHVYFKIVQITREKFTKYFKSMYNYNWEYQLCSYMRIRLLALYRILWLRFFHSHITKSENIATILCSLFYIVFMMSFRKFIFTKITNPCFYYSNFIMIFFNIFIQIKSWLNYRTWFYYFATKLQRRNLIKFNKKIKTLSSI